MSTRNGRNGPAHMASGRNREKSGGLSQRPSTSNNSRQRREPLRDNYTYEEPRPGSRGFEDVTSYSSSRKKRADQKELERQKKNKMSRGKKAAIIIAVVLLALIGGGVYYVCGYMFKDLTVKPITKDPEKLGINSEVRQQLDNSIKNIALLGLDSRNSRTTGDRSDVIMILTIDNKHKKIKMTSILRDSSVSIRVPDGDEGYYYTDDKITHAFHYGGEEGAETVVNTLNRNFALNIEDYVTVNFQQTAEIVDACGGVDIELTGAEIMHLNDNLWNLSQEVSRLKESDQESGTYEGTTYPVIAKEDFFPNIYGERNLYSADYEYEDGTYHLNGNQAVAYARIRYLDSDDVRASRQQNVLKALVNQAKGKSMTEYPEIIRKLMPMCVTSLDFSDILAIAPILLTDFTIETTTVPIEEDTPKGGLNHLEAWVYYYDLEEAAQRIHNFIYEDSVSVPIRDEDVLRVIEMARTDAYDDSSSGPSDTVEENWAVPPSESSVSSTPVEDPSSLSSEDPSSVPEGDPESSGSSMGENEYSSSTPESSGSEDTSSIYSSAIEGGGGEESGAVGYDDGGEGNGSVGGDGGGEEEGPPNGDVGF